ncbi:inositol monophosphatase [Ammoniphilus sp. CFH 90114]|uniref:inositol monophosphatase family protein n=1 Tax=Ammoniphilus sp. CFH 90114 TaxID=2493665 RepID=UPI00100DED33|nr:inositol monophosphatase [Ammoniphilus sp. CFH 90114]RXT05852.1 inositol monophosphatase [Ammoniphilus sp. CFH 90114]
MQDFKKMLAVAKEWAMEAGRISLTRAKTPLEYTYKSSPSDLVTQVDKEVEEFMIEKILNEYPDHGIVGEEGTFERDPKEFDTLWIIDPIDGTMNFVHQQLNYCISVAVVHKGESVFGVIYDPSRDELFWAMKGEGAFLNDTLLEVKKQVNQSEALICTSLFWHHRAEELGLVKLLYDLPKTCRGIRVYGCAALEMAYVAAGRIDAYVSLNLNPWDFAAGRVILEEAGGIASRLDGDPLPFTEASTVVASNPHLHPQLIAYIQTEPN